MLILSRKESEKILFPSLGITIEMLRVRGNKVRLGVDAPADVPVIRHELSGLKSIEFTADEADRQQVSRLTRVMRQRLSQACGMLNRLHERLEQRGDAETQVIVLGIFRELELLDREAGGAVEPADAPSCRALLVEDDQNVRDLLGGYLQLSGFEVTAAADGLDAMDYLSLHAVPDVMLVDMRMPRCDGPTFIRRVRGDQLYSGVRLYAVSGTDPAQLGVVTGPGGVDRWFPKPIDPEQLVRALAADLGLTAAV